MTQLGFNTTFPIILNNGKNKHSKLGKMARSMSMTGDNCPSECSLLGGKGCYAEAGPTALHAKRSRTIFSDVYDFMTNLLPGMKMRHNVSGDFFSGDEPNADYVNAIKEASRARPDVTSYGYTHGPERLAHLKPNELPNFTVNASCETFAEVRENTALGYPCTLVMHEDLLPKNEAGEFLPMIKRDDMVLRICPNLLDDSVKCDTCMLCARKGAARMRKNSAGEWVPLVVLFILHGVRKNKAAKVLAAKETEETMFGFFQKASKVIKQVSAS